MNEFWQWILKYSALLATGAISVVVAWIVDRFIAGRPRLISYASPEQWVMIAVNNSANVVGTATLFLENQGRKAAKDVVVGHNFLPAHNVFPDLPRDIVQTPSGGQTIRFHTLPPRVVVSISYLYFHPQTIGAFISYVGSEDGMSRHVPVMLQRIWPKAVINLLQVILLLGVWVVMNIIVSLLRVLWGWYQGV